MPQSDDKPWDGIVGAVKELASTAENAVRKAMPWDGIDTRPKPASPPQRKLNMDVAPVSLKTEVQAQKAAIIQPHERTADTQSDASNLAEIDAEIALAKKRKLPQAAIEGLMLERTKYAKKG